jgi:23S rRNA C2498 (ribose-2'-O)-methylase RlmM
MQADSDMIELGSAPGGTTVRWLDKGLFLSTVDRVPLHYSIISPRLVHYIGDGSKET